MPAAYMWDSRVNPQTGLPAGRVPVGQTTRRAGAGTELVLSPDVDLLANPSTMYPVTIDPQFDYGPTQDTWVQCAWNGSACVGNGVGWNSSELLLGTHNDGGENARSFLSFNYTPVYGASINWATLYLWETYSLSCAPAQWELWRTAWFDHTTNWGNQPAWLGHHHSSTDTKGYNSSCADDWAAIDATGWLKHAVDTGYQYWGLGLKATQEWPNGSATDSWKRFHSSQGVNDPILRFNFEYNQPPNTPTAVKPTGDCHPSCISGSTIRTTTPTLQAVVSDSHSGQTLNAMLEVWNQAQTQIVATTTIPSVASGTTVTWPTPALTNGATYHYRAVAQDQWGPWGPWSGWYTFTVNTAGPNTPTGVGVSGTGDCYQSCTSPAMLRTLRPTFKATVPHPFGDTLSVAFEVRNADQSAVIAGAVVPSVPAGTTPTWQPPSNLPQQAQLHVRVRSQDQYGRWSNFSGFYTFTVDTQAPALPSVSSPVYQHKDTGTWNGGVGVAGSFTFAPNGSTDVRAYEYKINGGTPTTVSVAAGASLTLDVRPAGDLEQLLEVRSIDQAGWASGWKPYPFLVRPQMYDVAYWKFDELSGATAAASSGGPSYNGTRVNGAVWSPSGINAGNPSASGNAVSLDGVDDYVSMPPVLSTNHAAGFSVSAWVKPSSLSDYHTIVSQQGVNTFAFRLYYKPEAGRWCFAVRDADTTTSATYGACSLATTQANVWTHLVGVYDRAAGKVRLYVNGGPQNGTDTPGTADEAAAPDLWPAAGAFRVGRSYSGEPWPGLIDEVRAYQRVLPEAEARQMFRDCWIGDCPPVPQAPEPSSVCEVQSAPPCIGEWKLDEVSGSTAPDTSGLENPATLYGGATWTSDGYDGTAAVALDGTSGYLATPDPVVLTERSFTVSAWVRLDQLRATDEVVLQSAGTGASAFKLMHEATTHKWYFGTTSHNGVGYTWHVARSAQTVRVGAWTHLVAVYDSAAQQLRLYVNGELAGSTGNASGQSSTSGLRIGAHGTAPGNGNLAGTIDVVRAYQGALSTAQVAVIYADQLAAPLVRAWYELEQESATEAVDYSGAENHATFSGQGATWTENGYDGSYGVELDGVAGTLTTAGSVLRTTDSFSVSAWANLADTTGEHTVLAQDGTLTSAFGLYSTTGGQWCLRLVHADVSDGGSTQVCGGSAQSGTWTHVAGMFDAPNGQLRLYVNGQLAASQSYTATTFNATGPLVIGRAKSTTGGTTSLGSYFAGVVDGVRAYQGAFTHAQAAAVYAGGEP